MNQGLIIFLSALLVGLVSLAVLCAYTNVKASKMPENNQMVQIFVSGAIVAGFISWIVTSGIVHGNSLVNMISSDVSNIVKTIDTSLKGGDETTVNTATFDGVEKVIHNDIKKSSVNIPAISGMVGGFLKSLGLDTNTLQELSVGMPTF